MPFTTELIISSGAARDLSTLPADEERLVREELERLLGKHYRPRWRAVNERGRSFVRVAVRGVTVDFRVRKWTPPPRGADVGIDAVWTPARLAEIRARELEHSKQADLAFEPMDDDDSDTDG